jgi:hypothetical protein
VCGIAKILPELATLSNPLSRKDATKKFVMAAGIVLALL